MLWFKCSQLPDICNLWRGVVSSFRHCLVAKIGKDWKPLLYTLYCHPCVSQTESPRTGRPSCVRWSMWSTMTTSATRHRQGTPCGGHLTGKCTTSGYPSLKSCRRMTPVNPLSECSHFWHIWRLQSGWSFCAMSACICDTGGPSVSWKPLTGCVGTTQNPQSSVCGFLNVHAAGLGTKLVIFKGTVQNTSVLPTTDSR